MPKFKATLLSVDGRSKKRVKVAYAKHLIQCGDFELASAKPLILRPVQTHNYRDALRTAKGRLVTGVSRAPWNETQSWGKSTRVHPPRGEPDYAEIETKLADTGWGDKNKEILSRSSGAKNEKSKTKI